MILQQINDLNTIFCLSEENKKIALLTTAQIMPILLVNEYQ